MGQIQAPRASSRRGRRTVVVISDGNTTHRLSTGKEVPAALRSINRQLPENFTSFATPALITLTSSLSFTVERTIVDARAAGGRATADMVPPVRAANSCK